MANTMKQNLLKLALTTALTSVSFQATAQQAWTGGTTDYTDGSVTVTTPDINNTYINQVGQLSIYRTPNSNVLANETVTIGQDNTSSHFVMKADNGNAVTEIFGTVQTKLKDSAGNATGSRGGMLTVLDTNGVFFKGAPETFIDAASVVASTGTLNEGKLINDGVMEFDGFDANSQIVIESGKMISVADGGLAAFVAPTVVNNGIISAKMGRVELAGANTKTTVDLYGDGLLEIAVDDSSNATLLAQNNGTINAEGGVIHMTTGAATNIVNSIVNMDGVANASSATQVGGKIVLGGGKTGTVKVSGTATANGKSGGGAISAVAQSVSVEESAIVEASATDNGNGGDIKILGNKFAAILGRASAKGGATSGNGGFIELSSDETFALGGEIDTTAANGETGTFLLDPRDLEIRVGQGLDLNPNTLYESTIEFLSLFNNINIEARRNITVSNDVYGYSDGVINIANGNDLTITTTNSPYAYTSGYYWDWSTFSIQPIITTEANNAGSINLTGNATYGANLEFKTSGNGSINILGATDRVGTSDIILSKLTTENGTINIDTMGKITVASVVLSDSGDVIFTNAADSFDDAITINASGSITTINGNVSLNNNGSAGGFITVYGDIDAASGDVLFNGRQNRLQNGSMITANKLTMNGSIVSQQSGSAITAALLEGSLAAAASFAGTNNDIDAIGDFATGTAGWSTGGFSLNNGSGQRVNITGDVTTTGGDVSVTNNARMDLTSTGSITTNGGDLNLTITNNGHLYVDGTVNADDVALTSGSNINMRNSSDITANTVAFASGNAVQQDSGATLIANILTGTADKSVTFAGLNNDIQTLGNITAGASPFVGGGFTIHDVNGFDVVGDVVTDNGDIVITTDADSFDDQIVVASTGSLQSTGGDITIDNNGSAGGFITVYGDIDAASGDVLFNGRQNRLQNGSMITANKLTMNGSIVSQQSGSAITAALLEGSLAAAASFAGTNNDIGAIGDFATGTGNWHKGGFTLVDNNGLNIVGTVSSDNTGASGTGDIAITTIGGALNVQSTGGVETLDANITLGSNSLVDIDFDATVSAGNGDITVNAPTVNLGTDLQTTGTVSGTATLVHVENDSAEIQDGVDVAVTNALVNVGSGTYLENISIDKGISIIGVSRDQTIVDASGGQDGFNISGNLGTNNVTIEKLAIRNAQRDGVHVSDTANLNNLRLSAMKFENNGLRGSAVFGDSVKGRTQIVNSLFFNNGLASTSNGDGDILFYHHNGDISLGNVTVQGNTGGLADYGVQIIGNPTEAESGTIVLNNLNVSGQYRVALLGMQQYDGLKSLSMLNVKLGGQTNAGNNSVSTAGWGGALFLSNLNETDLNVANTEFRSNDSNYIVLGGYNGNTEFTSTDIDATNATFLEKIGSEMTLAENFAVEDKVVHAMDFSPFGLVTWHSGNLYATQKSETGMASTIQRGVDNSDTNGNIWVQGGTFIGDVNVNKTVNLYGAQAGIDARNRTGADETVVLMQSPGFTVTADNVVIDGFEITDGDSGDAGIIVDGADNVLLTNNKIHDIRRGVDGDGIWIRNSKDGVVTQNWIYDISDDGVNARGFSGGLNVNNNLIENVRSTGLEAYRLLGTVSFTDNEINSAGRDGIRMHRADGSTVSNNVITMDDKGNGIILSNINNVTVSDNQVFNAVDGIVVEAGNSNIIDSNEITDVTNGIKATNAYDLAITNNILNGMGMNGIYAYATDNANITNNQINLAGANGIEVSNTGFVTIDNNDVQYVDGNGVLVTNSDNTDITNNTVTDAGQNGIEVNNTYDAFVNNNTANNNGGAGVFVNGSFETEVSENTLSDNAVGVEIYGSEQEFVESPEDFPEQQQFFISIPYGTPSDDTLILNNTISDNSDAGIKTSGNSVGLVTIANNELNANTIGMLLEGGEIDISNLLNPNTINGGNTAMRIGGGDVSLVNNSLGATIFNGQSGNYIELFDGGLFNPGTPTIIDGLAASWDGIIPLNAPLGAGLLTAVQREAIEDRLIDFDDNTTLGQIIVGLGLDLNEEDIFALDLFSLNPDAANVNVTFRGLPPVTSLNLAQLASLEPAAGGDINNASPEDLANLEPAAGGSDGCWASVADSGFEGTVNFSFGGNIDNAINDSACASN